MISSGDSQRIRICVAQGFCICRNEPWLGCLFNYIVSTVRTFLFGFLLPSVAYSLGSVTVLLPPSFFPSKWNVDPQHVVQIKEEN